jgi:hypothetical protein
MNTNYYSAIFKLPLLRVFVSSLEHKSVSGKVSNSSLQFTINGCDLELVEKLLKETHSCGL